MKKIIFAAALLAVIVGVSASDAQAAWFFKKKAETKTEVIASDNSAAAGRAAFNDESKEPKLTIMKKGEVLAVIVGGATVKTNTAGRLTVETAFGATIVPLAVTTTAETKVFRAYDGKGSAVADISVGDIISFEGILDTTVASLTVAAKKIKDYSLQIVGANYGGVVSALSITENTDGKVGSFKLPLANETNQFITVFVSATTTISSTTAKNLKLSDIRNGYFVISARGIVNTQKSELRAREIKFSAEKDAQSRMLYNELAKYDSDQRDYSPDSKDSNSVKTVFVKTSAGKRLEVKIDESAMTGTFTVKDKNGDYEAEKGVFKWMVKSREPVRSTLDDLDLIAGDKVWVSGPNYIKEGIVNAYRFDKQFKQ